MYTIKQDKTNVIVTVSINGKNWKDAEQKVYETTKGKFNVIGFRKGHAPKKVIEKQYGENVFFDDTLDYFLRTTMNEVLAKDPNLEPLSYPKTAIQKLNADGGVEFTLEFEVMPDFKLCKYTGLDFTKRSTKVTDEDIERVLSATSDLSPDFVILTGSLQNQVRGAQKTGWDAVTLEGGTILHRPLLKEASEKMASFFITPTKDLDIDDNVFKSVEAMIGSMTPYEREHPECLNLSRKRRIAKGAGVDISVVNRFIKQFEQSQKMMKQLPGMMGGMGGIGKKGKFRLPF